MASPHRAVSIAIVSVTIVLFEMPLSAQLGASGNQLWHQAVPGVDGALGADFFAGAVAAGDFDGDGFLDLAVGIRGEDSGGIQDSGAVQVFYGTAAGLSSVGDQLRSQASDGVIGAVEVQDFFGTALATGDFDDDDYDDLAIGVPSEDIGAIQDAGAVQILYGTAAGLSDAGNQLWHQDSDGILDSAEPLDNFGRALAAGDFDGDGRDDLAIGVPGQDVGGDNAAGAMNVIYGTSNGLDAAGNQFLHQNSSGILDSAQIGDAFGSTLTTGDFDDDGFDDLAIGVPFEDFSTSLAETGVVHILYGDPGGLSSVGNQLWSQDTAGVQDIVEEDDRFGSSLAAGDFSNDGFIDLAVGVPSETVGTVHQAGAVQVVYGSVLGLAVAGNQFWSQDSTGIIDIAEQTDNFGQAVAVGDFDNSGWADLAVGVRGEDIGRIANAGAVQVLYAAAPAIFVDGFESGDLSAWSSSVP